ncbi:hypothetical protein D9M69_644520 [compost metagenome]
MSVSLATRSKLPVSFSATVPVSTTATGASLTGFTVTLTVLSVLPPLPSDTTTVKLSEPLTLAFGR